jgi:hypothetical protein
MNGSIVSDVDLGSVRTDLAALRNDIGLLFEHLKSGARNGAATAADQITEGAGGLSQRVAREGNRTARAMDAWVEKRPALTFLIAVGVGYAAARLFRR